MKKILNNRIKIQERMIKNNNKIRKNKKIIHKK